MKPNKYIVNYAPTLFKFGTTTINGYLRSINITSYLS